MFESLSDRLDSAFKVLSGSHKITELNVAESIKEIRRALVAADVNYKIAKEFTDKVKDKAMGVENVLKNVNPGQLMVKIVMDELTELMGGQSVGINVKGSPGIVLIAGFAFMGLGTVALAAPPTWAPALLGVGFGGIHLVLGIVIMRDHGG